MFGEYNSLHIVVTKVKVVFQYALSVLEYMFAHAVILDVFIHLASINCYSLCIVVTGVAP